ncbi:MAG: hypothetical protein AB7F74_04275 [Parvibaculaceae bacterium]
MKRHGSIAVAPHPSLAHDLFGKPAAAFPDHALLEPIVTKWQAFGGVSKEFLPATD